MSCLQRLSLLSLAWEQFAQLDSVFPECKNCVFYFFQIKKKKNHWLLGLERILRDHLPSSVILRRWMEAQWGSTTWLRSRSRRGSLRTRRTSGSWLYRARNPLVDLNWPVQLQRGREEGPWSKHRQVNLSGHPWCMSPPSLQPTPQARGQRCLWWRENPGLCLRGKIHQSVFPVAWSVFPQDPSDTQPRAWSGRRSPAAPLRAPLVWPRRTRRSANKPGRKPFAAARERSPQGSLPVWSRALHISMEPRMLCAPSRRPQRPPGRCAGGDGKQESPGGCAAEPQWWLRALKVTSATGIRQPFACPGHLLQRP